LQERAREGEERDKRVIAIMGRVYLSLYMIVLALNPLTKVMPKRQERR